MIIEIKSVAHTADKDFLFCNMLQNGAHVQQLINLTIEDDSPTQKVRNALKDWIRLKGYVEPYIPEDDEVSLNDPDNVADFIDLKVTESGRTYGLVLTPAGERWVLAD